MKSNFFKYIFIIFAILIIIYSIYALYFKDKENTNEQIEEAVQEVSTIKDLRLGISNFDNINPLISNNREILNIDKLVFEPLLSINEKYEIENCLATEYSKISDTTYIVKVDNNRKWHDGSPVIAKDIQFTIDRLKEGKSVYSYNVEKVNSVEILDASTVKINLSQEVPFFEYNLTFPILPNNYYIGEDFYASAKTPIGTGMFLISSINNDNIVLKKNDKWWNKTNKNSNIEEINIKIFSEIGKLYNSFKLGNIDIFTTSNNTLEQYIGTIGYSKKEYKGREFNYLAFNCENSILKDSSVRKAISYSIDKTNILSSIYNNQAYVANFPLDYGNYLYNEENQSSGYNPEQAKKILTDNGWEYKNNKWQKTQDYRTNRLNLTITVNAANPERVSIAENIKSQLEQIGMKITISKVSDANYKNILSNKNYEMIITGVYNSYSPNLNTFFGQGNIQNYNNEEIKKTLQEVKNINDKNILKEKYKSIIEIYEKEMPFIGLSRNKVNVVKSQSLAGELTPNNYFSYYNIETWNRM